MRLFLEDTSADAFSKVVDRLLASSAYGEHWGRHWLDIVRYADTAGETADFPVREAYKYRNYVISALNGDKPYDQFIREQVAGDILVVGDDLPVYLEKVTATGFLAISRRFGFDIQNYHHLTIQDTLDTLGQAFLGLTLGCARCHDHKFDPISARDYYALYGILESTQYAFPGSEEIKRPRSFNPALPSADAKVIKEAFDAEMLQLSRQIKETEEVKKKLEAELAALNKQVALLETKIPASTNDALSTPPATPRLVTSPPNKNAALPDAGRPGQTSPGTPPGLDPAVASRGPSRADAPSPQQRIAAIRSRLDEVGTSNRILLDRRTKGEEKGPYPVLYGVTEGTGRNSHIHIRGEPKSVGDEVPRGFLEILGGQRLAKGELGSGRRQLAEWLVSPENPLTARVMVNRIWQHHFGSGLVPSENNFGARGRPPSHPELLDGLALRFMEGGWSIKAMHRLILLSATYQQSSQVPLASPTIDPENRLLSRFPRRRLQAEAVRDSMLDLGGNLDRTVGGPHPFPPIAEWNFTQHAPFYAVYESNQRSVYLMTQRIRRHPFLALFDAADVNTSTAKRDNTTVPTQALFFMNSPFVHTQAAGLSKRLLAVSAPNSQRIARGFEMAYARLPRDGEINESLEFLEAYRLRLIQAALPETERESQAWAAWARTLLSRNEFVYID